MRGVTISDTDSRGFLSFDLRDILRLLGSRGLASMWHVRGVECIGGEAADALHRVSDSGELLDGSRLESLARDITQVIDGEFSGRLPDSQDVWIVIRAVDSSAFDVLTDDESILHALIGHFARVDDLRTGD